MCGLVFVKLFKVAKLQKKSRCLLIRIQLNRSWHSHRVKYYTFVKQKKGKYSYIDMETFSRYIVQLHKNQNVDQWVQYVIFCVKYTKYQIFVYTYVCIEYFRKKTQEIGTDNFFQERKTERVGERETFSSGNFFVWVAALLCVTLARLNFISQNSFLYVPVRVCL